MPMADPCSSFPSLCLSHGCCQQYECSSRNVEILENTTDAKGRKLQVVKVPCPPPMFRTFHEADTMDVSDTGALLGVAWLSDSTCWTLGWCQVMQLLLQVPGAGDGIMPACARQQGRN